jgi:hypothetical protein
MRTGARQAAATSDHAIMRAAARRAMHVDIAADLRFGATCARSVAPQEVLHALPR